MAQNKISLKQLQRAVAREKSRIRVFQERGKLERQLKELRASGKTDVVGRIGRGFKVLSKKVGNAAMRQGSLIRERQIQEAKRSKKKRRGMVSGFDPLGSLDF